MSMKEIIIKHYVTPCVGVWIETVSQSAFSINADRSHPAWVCGLKQLAETVALCLGSHTLRGCVD